MDNIAICTAWYCYLEVPYEQFVTKVNISLRTEYTFQFRLLLLSTPQILNYFWKHLMTER